MWAPKQSEIQDVYKGCMRRQTGLFSNRLTSGIVIIKFGKLL